MRSLGQLLAMAWELPRYLGDRLDPSTAATELRARLEQREARFLAVAQAQIYEVPASPHRALLLSVGCDLAELTRAVQRRGIEVTLEQLRGQGVYTSVQEFKGLVPLERGRLRLSLTSSAFDGSRQARRAFEVTTSGTAGSPRQVGYAWELIREHSINEWLLVETLGVTHLPLLLWLPPPPSIAGIQYVLMNLRWGRVPVAWFSPFDDRTLPWRSRERLGNKFIRQMARHYGALLPQPVYVPLDQAEIVARAVHQQGRCLLRTYVSSAVRVAQAAQRLDLDLSGCMILCGGEPLTDSRREYVERSGAQIFPRYSSTEAGLMGAACSHRVSTDDMHLYTDRLVAIAHDRQLLFSSLSPYAGKVLFNTDIGDEGELHHATCDCRLGQLGLTTHVRQVRSRTKSTAEGMNLILDELVGVIQATALRHGATPDEVQLWQIVDAAAGERLVVAVAPQAVGIDLGSLQAELHDWLEQRGPGGRLSRALWEQASTLRVIRAPLRSTSRGKFPPIVRHAASPGDSHRLEP